MAAMLARKLRTGPTGKTRMEKEGVPTRYQDTLVPYQGHFVRSVDKNAQLLTGVRADPLPRAAWLTKRTPWWCWRVTMTP